MEQIKIGKYFTEIPTQQELVDLWIKNNGRSKWRNIQDEDESDYKILMKIIKKKSK